MRGGGRRGRRTAGRLLLLLLLQLERRDTLRRDRDLGKHLVQGLDHLRCQVEIIGGAEYLRAVQHDIDPAAECHLLRHQFDGAVKLRHDVLACLLDDAVALTERAARFGDAILQFLLAGADLLGGQLGALGLAQAVWIGFCQIASAVFPGTSRSMATIAAGQVGGMTRTAALEFSFFLSMPTMAAATGYDLYKTLREGHASALGGAAMTPHAWGVLGVGFWVSFVVAYAVVAWFMGWVRRRGFVPFAVWRILAGASVLLWMTGGAR